MALPAQVQRQLDHAESLLAGAATPVAAQPAAEPVVPVAAEVQQVEQPAAAPVAPEPTTQVKPPPKEDFEHKYKTLQGIHNSHVKALKDRADAAELRAQQLEERLNEVIRRLDKPEAAEKPPLDPKDAEVFGADLVEMVRRTAEQMFGQAARRIDDRLKALEQHLQGTNQMVGRTAEQVFLDQLRQAVPDYEAVNANEGFLAWLAEEDPVYGVPRQNALTAAANALDAQRVAKVFLAWKATQQAPEAPPKPSAQLEKQVAPRSAASAPVAQAQRQVFTVAEVEAFYRDVAQGKYRGREAEAAQVEAMFNAALSEGRLVTQMPRMATV